MWRIYLLNVLSVLWEWLFCILWLLHNTEETYILLKLWLWIQLDESLQFLRFDQGTWVVILIWNTSIARTLIIVNAIVLSKLYKILCLLILMCVIWCLSYLNIYTIRIIRKRGFYGISKKVLCAILFICRWYLSIRNNVRRQK